MKYKYYFFIALLIFFLLFYLIQHLTICEAGSSAKLGTTATLLPTGEFGSVFDDFNDGNSENNWGYSTFSGGDGGTCAISYVGGACEGANCLKMDYNVPGAGSYSWYTSKMGSENIESSNFNGLIFWVKGAAGGEYFKIALKTIDCNSTGRSNAYLYITDYLDGGVTTTWQKVVIPLKNFANITNFTKMEEFTIAFEHDQSLINGSPTSGTVYIDYIKFTNVAGGFDVVRMDHYGDKLGVCALGGNAGIFYASGGGCSISYTNIATHTHNYGLMCQYNVASGFAGVYHNFGGGNDGGGEMPCNFSEYSKISFWIKAKSAGENPVSIVVELWDADGGKFKEIGGITTAWNQLTVNLSDFEDWGSNPLDKTTIKKHCFTFDWRCNGSKTGTVYIDEVQFEK